MADRNTKIGFEAQDNGVSSFMKKFMSESKQMYSEIAKEAAKQTSNQKEQLRIIEAQIKALDRQNKLEKEQNRIILDRKRATGQISEESYIATLAGRKGRSAEDNLQISILKDILAEAKESNSGGSGGGGGGRGGRGPGTFAAVMAAGFARDALSLITRFPSAQTGLDFVSPMYALKSAAVGATLGTAADIAIGSKFAGFGVGQTQLGILGAQTGKEVGQMVGDAVTRTIRTKDEYNRSYFGYKALGGREVGMNLSSSGFDDSTVAGAMLASTRAAGTGRGASRNAALSLMLSRLGFADEAASMAAFGMQRSGGGSGATNIQKVLGVAFAEGLDRAKFSDVIKTQTQLMQHFAATSTNPSSIDANRAIFEFNRMGGMFSAGDPRSVGNIMGISQGLTNPGTAFGQAQNYAVLRKLHPNANPWELRKMQAKGLQTPGFLKGIIDQTLGMTNDPTLQRFMLESRFGQFGVSGDAIDTLFQRRGELGSMSEKELSKMLGLKAIKEDSDAFTTQLTKDQAAISNAFRESAIAGAEEMAKQYTSYMKEANEQLKNIFIKLLGLDDEAPLPPPPAIKFPSTSGPIKTDGVSPVHVRFGWKPG